MPAETHRHQPHRVPGNENGSTDYVSIFLQNSLAALHRQRRDDLLTQQHIDEMIRSRSFTFLKSLQNIDQLATYQAILIEGAPPKLEGAIVFRSIYHNVNWVMRFVRKGHEVTLEVYHSVAP
ncbi:MAG TPA: hypothetical protein VFG51_00465 [Candidatus Saccharimonadia bacterium]|nr:hypothetical protein [Candidatus Saccharimonadia bacterium]